MNRARMRFSPVLLVSVALVAGCGSSSSSSSSSAASAPAASAPAQSTSSTASPGAAGVTVTTKKAKKLGTILAAGPKHLTVYLFEADKGSKSSCSGACLAVWPAVTGKASVSGAAMSADLGTITRADGTTQVTYKGHPLYFFAKDKDSGDAYGAGIKSFGAKWYVLAPSGKKIDNA